MGRLLVLPVSELPVRPKKRARNTSKPSSPPPPPAPPVAEPAPSTTSSSSGRSSPSIAVSHHACEDSEEQQRQRIAARLALPSADELSTLGFDTRERYEDASSDATRLFFIAKQAEANKRGTAAKFRDMFAWSA